MVPPPNQSAMFCHVCVADFNSGDVVARNVLKAKWDILAGSVDVWSFHGQDGAATILNCQALSHMGHITLVLPYGSKWIFWPMCDLMDINLYNIKMEHGSLNGLLWTQHSPTIFDML